MKSGAARPTTVSGSSSSRPSVFDVARDALVAVGYVEEERNPNGLVALVRYEPVYHAIVLSDNPYMTPTDMLSTLVNQRVNLAEMPEIVRVLSEDGS
jgi:hypothetical protein